MESGVYVLGSQMNALTDRLQIVAANLANANSTGFKRVVATFAGEAAQTSSEPGGLAPLWPELAGTSLDISPGALRQTGRPLDLAVRGDAFFVVETTTGPLYTRKGRLFQNAQGELTDAAGNRYMADSGSLRIPETAREITVQRNGEVLADGQSLGRLALVDTPRTDMLVPVGAGLYRSDAPVRPAVGSEVVQGVVEESNVRPMEEMVALIDIMRAYDAGTKVLRKMDTLNDQLIKTAT